MQGQWWPPDVGPKYTDSGVERTITPADTVRRVMPLMERVGVTRVGEVTWLDRVGIPNFTTVRPRERGNGISYYNGKGATRVAALAGALMEAIERHCGERCEQPRHVGTVDELRARGDIVDPDTILLPPATAQQPAPRLEWVEGRDLLSGRPVHVPLNAVVCPYEPAAGCVAAFLSSTHGLAAGNTYGEAICHGLCEVIERDSESIADATSELSPVIESLLGAITDGASEEAVAPPRRTPLIDLATLPPRALGLVRKLRRAGLAVYLRDVTATTGIAAVTCTIVERLLDGRSVSHGGAGAHPDARIAVTRALTEAAQSRVGHIQGGREDLPELDHGPVKLADPRRDEPEARPYSSLPSREHATVADDIADILTRLAADGFQQVVAVDLTRPELGVPAVRILVPGAETWSMFFSHVGRARLGERAGRALRAAIRAPA